MLTTAVKLISDGTIKYDGGCLFGSIPKVYWEDKVSTDRKNRITLGLNCALIQSGNRNILIDTGIGSKDTNGLKETYGLGPTKLTKNLKTLGIKANNIDAVLLTHLHFDHSGGCTKVDRTGSLIPAFPKATYYVQENSLLEARNPTERGKRSYKEEDFEPLEEAGQLELLYGESEPIPGVHVIETGGHCKGHQIVLLTQGGEKIAYLGDLVPTPYHLNPVCTSAYDRFPEDSATMKEDILKMAIKEGWLIIFSHGYENSARYLEESNGHRYLRPVEL